MLRSGETILCHLLFDPSKFFCWFVDSRNWDPREFDVPKCEGSVSDVYWHHDTCIVRFRFRIPTVTPSSFLSVRSLIFSESLSGVVFFGVREIWSEKWMFYESSKSIVSTIIHLSRVWTILCLVHHQRHALHNFAWSRHVIKMNCYAICKYIFWFNGTTSFMKLLQLYISFYNLATFKCYVCHSHHWLDRQCIFLFFFII